MLLYSSLPFALCPSCCAFNSSLCAPLLCHALSAQPLFARPAHVLLSRTPSARPPTRFKVQPIRLIIIVKAPDDAIIAHTEAQITQSNTHRSNRVTLTQTSHTLQKSFLSWLQDLALKVAQTRKPRPSHTQLSTARCFWDLFWKSTF